MLSSVTFGAYLAMKSIGKPWGRAGENLFSTLPSFHSVLSRDSTELNNVRFSLNLTDTTN